MKNETPLNKAAFVKRFTALCLRSGLGGLPRDELDRHVLFKSAVLCLGRATSFREVEVTERLRGWAAEVGDIPGLDAVSMRRALVDAGYLTRTADGSTYSLATDGPRLQFFDPSVDEVEIALELQNARAEMERRKQAYLERAKG